MNNQQLVALRDGNTIPQLGLGVFQTPPDLTAAVVKTALATGYRHVDTAAIYVNEVGVGEGLRTSELAREDVFVTTKLWNADQGFDAALKAFDHSVKRLGLDYLDLYLIHWPSPRRNLYVESWRALARLKEEGRVRSIGVSNFGADHLKRIIDETGVTPVLNQIELHPHFQQRALIQMHKQLGIATQSWSPLGQGKELADPVIGAIAARLGFDVVSLRLELFDQPVRIIEIAPGMVKTDEFAVNRYRGAAGKAAAGWVFDGNTPEETYQRVLRGIEEGDPAVLDATEPPAIGPAAGYTQDDLARDLGIDPRDRALPRAVSAAAAAFTGSFWQETERAAGAHSG